MKILLCGGGNAIHVLSSFVGTLPDCDVSVLSLYPGEANRFKNEIPMDGIRCINDIRDDITGKPVEITDDSKIARNSDVVIFAIPSFAHHLYLKALKPHLKRGVILGAMPGEGGFDLCARHILGNDFVNDSSLFALETLPWACRIIEYGKSVEVLGTKKEIDVVISPQRGGATAPVLDILQRIVGPLPILNISSNFLAVTLMNINSLWHPTISYGFYRNKNMSESFDTPPLFYQGADKYTGDKLSHISDEVLKLKQVLIQKYPDLDLKGVHHVREWMIRSYGDDIGDKSSIHSMLITNKGYRGLVHPMIKKESNDGSTKYYPNLRYRYFTEDVPCGLIVTRGIAELAGVETPHMDEVILWCQDILKKEFLVDGKVAGRDLGMTRAPQTYGYKDLDTFIQANRYVFRNDSGQGKASTMAGTKQCAPNISSPSLVYRRSSSLEKV